MGGLAGLACAQASGPAPSFIKIHTEPFVPNYAKGLLGPFRGTGVAPELLRMYNHFPVRVTVLDNSPLFSDRAYKMVVTACQKWVVATQHVENGGVSFSYRHAATTADADIVVVLVTPNEIGKWSGLTTNMDTYQMVRLRMVNSTGEWLPYWVVERVTTHEIGHALGISGHSPNPQDVMSENAAASEVTLSDVNTLRIAYGGTFH